MGRRKTVSYKPYQRRPNSVNRFVQLFHDLLDSPAFQDLTSQQKVLYVFCVAESHGQAMLDNLKEGKNERLFYMNRHLQVNVHRLYSETDTRGFNRDMAALIEHGFVNCIESNYRTRRKNLYSLSHRWHNWGTDAFETPEDVMTNHMKITKAKLEARKNGREKKKTPAPMQYQHTGATQDGMLFHSASNQDEWT